MTILARLGYWIGAEDGMPLRHSHQALGVVVFFCLLLLAVYIWYDRRKTKGHQ